MPFIAYALPIVPGQAERAGQFDAELAAEPELRAHYEALNRDQNVRRHMEWVQRTPMGDLLVVVFEVDTPERMMRGFEDNAYDRWWRQRVEEVHGFDPGDPDFHPNLPPIAYDWSADRDG
jgi:hypothetical protein